MPKAVIFQYAEYSNGARNLANELKKGGQSALHTLRSNGGGQRLNNTIRADTGITEPHICICWGKPALADVRQNNRLFLNWSYKDNYTRKDLFFKEFSTPNLGYNIRLPQHAFNRDDAAIMMREIASYREADKPLIVERHNLSGHSGDGIRILKAGDELSNGLKLYVKYIPKAEEYRVHFFKPNNSFFVQQKRLKRDAPESDTRHTIRNHLNGWVYCTEDLNVPADVMLQAENFVRHPRNKLDFGAIDIIYNRRHDKAFVLEVNSAPGVEGKTVTWYAKNIKDAVDNHDFTQPCCYFTPRA